MDYIKKELPSYNLHMIKTNKFKTTSIEVLFSKDIKKEEITITNFLASIMNYSTKIHNQTWRLAQRAEELYAARLIFNNYRLGNQYITDFTMKILNDKYAEEGLFSDCIDFLKEELFYPNVDNGLFDKKSFDVVMNDEKTQIERLKEDPRKYSMMRLFELTDDKAEFSFNPKGYLEDLNKINRDNLFKYYKEFIKCNKIDIFVIGDIDFDYVEKVITEKLVFNEKRVKDSSFMTKKDKVRKKVQEVIESDNTNQAKLSIAYRLRDLTEYERDYVLSLYNIILGGSADSKFFKNIREKFSLCYYISSTTYRLDNLLTVSSGITKDNFDKVKTLIDKEMNDMKKGKISDEELNKAKEYYVSTLDEMLDNPSQIIGIYFSIDKIGLADIEKRKEIIKKITIDDIVKLSNKVYLDTIYLLGGDSK